MLDKEKNIGYNRIEAVRNIKIYLDTCCYNRPFDDSSQEIVKNEIAAKQEIQNLIKHGKIDLTTSYVLVQEINSIRLDLKRNLILDYIRKYANEYITTDCGEIIREIAQTPINNGIKDFDALHTACAIFTKCDYLITVDKRLLKYKPNELKIVNPIDFINEWRKIQ